MNQRTRLVRFSAWLLLLCQLFVLIGCKPPVTDTPQDQEPRPPFENCAHVDENNDDHCDTCGITVLVVLDFYAINDLHGKFADGDTHPGVDELTTYLKTAVAADDSAILLSSGDTWQGSSESNLTRGFILTDWMNEMDFACMTLGNHEYDWGEEAIEQNAALAEFPFLAINIYDRATNERVDYCEPSVLVEQDGLVVGIIGAIGDCYSSIAPDKVEDVYFKTGRELTELVKAESERLRALGADLIVYSLHGGHSQSSYDDVSVIATSRLSAYYDISLSDGYVDLVFEGHTHQRYVLKDEHGVYHLQNGGDNKGISHVELAVNPLNDTWRIRKAEFVSTDRYSSLADDPIVNDLMTKYEDQVSLGATVLGHNAASRDSYTLRSLVAKLYYEFGVSRWGEQYNIVLGGGYLTTRSPGYLPAGEVTYSQLQSVFPFDNRLVLCSVKGRDLSSKFFNTNNSNYFIHYGDYGASIKNNIDPNATYYVIVDSYTSSYAPNRLTVVEEYAVDYFARDLLADYIKAGGLKK
ncbi:MAG: bifunctional metallophosphatase/5'-nucleotidase [Ruminococcaceae bacterium]|nr:bifunctional metallophosphatase/5'-nucleotidase [Oscillospiraceae bacterium]